MTRRKRIDSVEASVEVAQAAIRHIAPPSNVELDNDQLVFFANVIEEFARSEWTAHQLELAAMLARTMAELESEQRLLKSEGSVIKTDRGTPVINPRKTSVQMCWSSIFSGRRSLQLHARAQGGEARDVGRRRGIAQEGEAEARAGDDLIARPN